MTNYDLEETELLNYQLLLSIVFIINTLISITLTNNQILKHKHKEAIYTKDQEQNVLKFSRLLGLIIAFGFLLINTQDKKVKQKYNLCNEKNANLQINASTLTLIAALIVLYIAFSSPDNTTSIENPEL